MPMRRSPPEGFTPLRACVACPPKGLAVDVSTMLSDFPVDGYQMIILFMKRQYFFGACLVGILSLTLVGQITALQGKSLFDETKTSLKRGILSDELANVFRVERAVEAPGSALLGGYGMSLLSDMTSLDAALAITSLLLSTKAMAVYFSDIELGHEGKKSIAKVRMPMFLAIVRCVRIFTALGFFANFVVASRNTHPILTLPIYVTCAFATGLLQERNSKDENSKDDTSSVSRIAMQSVVFPTLWCYPVGCSVCCIRSTSTEVCEPAWPHILVNMARDSILVGMCTVLSLPDGLIAWSTLARTMGAPAFHAEFLKPTMAVITQDFNDGIHMTYASACFRTFLLTAAVVGTIVTFAFNLYVLIFMRSYCCGVYDEAFEKAGLEKLGEIKAWCDEWEAEAETERSLLCEMT